MHRTAGGLPRCIVDAPYGFRVGLGQRDKPPLGPDFRREERGEELAVVGGVHGASLMHPTGQRLRPTLLLRRSRGRW